MAFFNRQGFPFLIGPRPLGGPQLALGFKLPRIGYAVSGTSLSRSILPNICANDSVGKAISATGNVRYRASSTTLAADLGPRNDFDQ